MPHEIVRVRHDTRRRSLTVRRVESITLAMLRIHLGGPDLAGFTSLSPDDHVKLFVPGTDADRRDYTPRSYDPGAGELALDFALHEAGPATRWAMAARPGDVIEVGGPRGSIVVPNNFDWWLLIGDETALPSIGRRLEEMRPDVPVTTVVTVAGPEEKQHFDTAAAHRAEWVYRPLDRADDPAPLLDALARLATLPGDGFVWIAAEASVA